MMVIVIINAKSGHRSLFFLLVMNDHHMFYLSLDFENFARFFLSFNKNEKEVKATVSTTDITSLFSYYVRIWKAIYRNSQN